MHILFDLDGTLTNPEAGITACIRHAFAGLQLSPPPPAELKQWIGPPLHDSFAQALNCSERAHQAVALYRDRFATVGLYENQLYEGIPTMLSVLKQQNYTLWVSTSKPQVFAQKIIQHFQLMSYFAGVYGSELNGDRAHKTELIAHLLRSEGINSREAVMIGDRHYDMTGARQNGLSAIGVTWGFGTAPELLTAGAQQLCHAPVQLPKVMPTAWQQ